MTKTGLEFGISVIVICLIFGIWDFYSSSRDPGLALHVRPLLSGTQLLAIWPGISCGCLNPELLPRRDRLLGEIGNGLIKSFL